MAVYTRVGSQVKIISGDIDASTAVIQFDDGESRQVHFSELIADDGINEIIRQIELTQSDNI